MDKLTVLISNHHHDLSGGGQHIRQIIHLLNDHADVYFDHDPSAYLGNIMDWSTADRFLKPDIHLLASYRGWVEPRGRLNVQLCYYPVKKKIDGWQLALVCHDFVARAVKELWGIPSIIVPLHIDNSIFTIGKKSRTCINIGNYFLEDDGHSKNQHLVVKWFLERADAFQFDRLILHGFPNNPAYVEYLRGLCANDDRIKINCASSVQEIASDLASSSWLIHANGYGRTLSEQTEHFGIVAVEALLSGTQPLVHASGGCPEILGVVHWSDFQDLDNYFQEGRTTPPEKLRDCGAIYSKERARRAIELFLDQTKIMLSKNMSTTKRKLNLGCGSDYRSDYINVDVGNCRKDIEWNLENFPLPFDESAFDEILMQHVIEHIDRTRFVEFMREIHRILVAGGKAIISAPYYLSKNAFTDFTHKNFMTEDSFGYFDPTHPLRELGRIYGIEFEFNVNVTLDRERSHPEVNVHYEMRAIK